MGRLSLTERKNKMSTLLITSPAEKKPITRDSIGQVSVTLVSTSMWEYCDSAKFFIRDAVGNQVWAGSASFSNGNAQAPVTYNFPAGHYTVTAQSAGMAGVVHTIASREFDIV